MHSIPHHLPSATNYLITTSESMQALHQVGHTMTSCVDDHEEIHHGHVINTWSVVTSLGDSTTTDGMGSCNPNEECWITRPHRP